MMNTKKNLKKKEIEVLPPDEEKKPKKVGQKIDGKEITEGVTGSPFGGKATKPSRIEVKPKGTDKQNPFDLKESMVKPKTKRNRLDEKDAEKYLWRDCNSIMLYTITKTKEGRG